MASLCGFSGNSSLKTFICSLTKTLYALGARFVFSPPTTILVPELDVDDVQRAKRKTNAPSDLAAARLVAVLVVVST
jgi:hypothetical protein